MSTEPELGQLSLDDIGLQSAAFTTETAGSGTLPSAVASEPAGGEVVAPKIRRLWMRNFKGFEEFEVRLTDFNVLAGPKQLREVHGVAGCGSRLPYGASFGNPRLLEEFAETEVPAEIADAVRAISAATGQLTTR